MSAKAALADALAVVKLSEQHRVLTRVPSPAGLSALGIPNGVTGVAIDVEGTGLDLDRSKVIEVGAVRFTTEDAKLVLLDEYEGLQDPGEPLTDEVIAVTGIRDESLAGQQIDAARLQQVVEGADFVIAHNAAYDRQMLERAFPGLFEDLDFACSFRDVRYPEFGIYGGGKLEMLALSRSMFYDAHRALDDAKATLSIMASIDDGEARSALSVLELASRSKSFRLAAAKAPFESKDDLKRAGFRWDGEKKWWHVDAPTISSLAERVRWLADKVYMAVGDIELPVAQITAMDRYSVREPLIAFRLHKFRRRPESAVTSDGPGL